MSKRKLNDAYMTPYPLAVEICKQLKERILPPTGVDVIIEPSAGSGNFVKAARLHLETLAKKPYILAIEPYIEKEKTLLLADSIVESRWEDWQGEYALSPNRKSLIVGNPPYNLPGDGRGGNPTTAEKHALLALDRLPHGSWLVFLLRASFFAGGGRIERLYSKHPLRALWPVTPRPSFTGDGKTDPMEYAVYVWEKGYSGPADTTPLIWKDYK